MPEYLQRFQRLNARILADRGFDLDAISTSGKPFKDRRLELAHHFEACRSVTRADMDCWLVQDCPKHTEGGRRLLAALAYLEQLPSGDAHLFNADNLVAMEQLRK